MPSNPDRFDRWYLRLLAGIFAILCGLSTLRYLWIDFFSDGFVPLAIQIVCFLFTAAAIGYWVKPRLGHHALLGLTVFILSTHVGGHLAEYVFWFFVLGLLLLPYLPERRRLASL